MVETGLIRECNVSNFDKLVAFNMTYYEVKKYQVNRGISEVAILQQAFFHQTD